ncbi:MAG: acyl carrier protein [Polyangiaceae bacterium]
MKGSDTVAHENLKDELKALILEIAEIDTIEDEAHFKDRGIDSMMGVEIVAAIERKYQVKFDDSELQQITTLAKSFDLVKSKLDAKAA